MGRFSFSHTDALGRTVQDSIPGIAAVHYTYDSNGFLTHTRQGDRVTTFAYNEDGMLESVTDPLNRTTTMEYDPVGRVTQQTLADGRIIEYEYDANGNLVALAPPGKPAHFFDHTPVNLTSMYLPPQIGDTSDVTYYGYNLDRQLTKTILADSSEITVVYDTSSCACKGGSKPLKIISERGEINYKYSEITGQLEKIISPSNDTLKYSYDGNLPTSLDYRGIINAKVDYTYNNDFMVTSQRINNNNDLHLSYGNDGLLESVGDLNLTHDSQNSLLKQMLLKNTTTNYGYNEYGELKNIDISFTSNDLFKTEYTYDDLGRITDISETILDSENHYRYDYDLIGRLQGVSRNDTTISTYVYDSNSNRLAFVAGADTISALYDDQDRILKYGDTEFLYHPKGYLCAKITNNDTTKYVYDDFGNLISVHLPDGTLIEYIIDGQNRRIGKKVDGILEKRYIYSGNYGLIAELDNSNQVSVRYIYGSRAHVPDYMIKDGTYYRLIKDHLGSVRLVVDAILGTIVQQINYDEFGNVLYDTNPGFQPFGFAGGLYDEDTKLVRFGFRDYDAHTGRWTQKDPLGFGGGHANLYAYCLNDPINYIDEYGQSWGSFFRGVAEGAVTAFAFTTTAVALGASTPFLMTVGAIGLAAYGLEAFFLSKDPCADWSRFAGQGVGGLLGGWAGGRAGGALKGVISGKVGSGYNKSLYGNTPEGRPFTKHYGTETGPKRNIPGSVVDHVINTNQGTPVEGGKIVYYDPVNNVTVVTGTGESIVSVHKGEP